jgi:fucose permease
MTKLLNNIILASISGWIVVFMTRARQTSLYFSSLCSSGFWIGMAVGRLSLGIVTDTIGIRFGTMVYLGIAIGFQLLFSLIPIRWVSLLMITLLGFFLGPLFPNGIVMLTRLLPHHLHIAGVSFVASVGQIGAALIPFASGALTQALGIQIFQSIIFALLAITFSLWICFPKEASAETVLDDNESHSGNFPE